MGKQREIFSGKVSAGQRTYFFDVKEASEGAKYLVICESKRVGESFERNRIMLFEDSLPAFSEALQKAMAAFK